MARFLPGTPVISAEPSVRVEHPLDAGSYRFQLVVVDDERNASAPAELVVRLVGDAPPPPLRAPKARPKSPRRRRRPAT